ncbi:uracil-DNA glycosylase [Patescibacteria group bacterium]|nr:uracil-DNA glycosylase [Patescibacteria group bacterium]
MDIKIEDSWKKMLAPEFTKEYFQSLTLKVDEAYLTTTVFPPSPLVFNALQHCPFNQVSVVILGQDPYHNTGQAHGLAFSVPDGTAIPPSLLNIYRELASDLDQPIPQSGNLERWADQGVLLLNTTLTVKAHKAFSHHDFGWERFTDAVITAVSEQKENVVFLLWGAPAIKKRTLIDETKHAVLTAPHPSPLSAYRGFFGCRHFSKTNDYLRAHNKPEIIW